MKDDRFRPDAAARRVVPLNLGVAPVTSAALIGLLDDPKIAAAVRVPGEDLARDLARDRMIYGASFVDVTTKDGKVTSVERVPPTMSGNRADRVIVDDPRADEAVRVAIAEAIEDGAIAGMRDVRDAIGRELFEPTKPLASVGRNSIPKSHRGEGVNFVD